MRDVAGMFVCHAMVAENGVRETVCTFAISGGGPAGADVVVVAVVSVGDPLAGGVVPTPGMARNLRSLTYGELKVTSAPLPALDREAYVATARPAGPESRCKPGLQGPPAPRPVRIPGRPVG